MRSDKLLQIVLAYEKDSAVLSQENHLGKTPLVLVAEAANT